MKIFLLAFEGESYLIGQLARRFKQSGNSIFVFNCDHHTITHTQGAVYSYYERLGLTRSEYTHLDDVFTEVNRCEEGSLSADDIDFEYLEKFEREYCKTRKLHQLLTLDPLLSNLYHHRDIYYLPRDKNIYYKFLEVSLKKINLTFISGEFDFVFSIYSQYFFKALVYEVASSLGIPDYCLASSRIEDVFIFADNLCVGMPDDIQLEMSRLREANAECPQATAFIHDMITTARHPYQAHAQTMRFVEGNLTLRAKRAIVSRAVRSGIKGRLVRWKKYRAAFKPDYFLPSWLLLIKGWFLASLRSLAYQRDASLNAPKLPDCRFVYFAMHVIPESTTLTMSHTQDEMEALFQLSKVLPVDWKIVVKINPSMLADLDSHPNEYYRRMNRLPNVIFVNPMLASAEIIRKSSAVAALSGTVLLEGVINGKPAFRWGAPEFAGAPGVYEFDRRTFEAFLMRPLQGDIRFYIQSCFNLGLRFDVNYLTETGERFVEAAEYVRQVTAIEHRVYQLAGQFQPVSS